VWPHVPDVNVTIGPALRLEDVVAWSGSVMTPVGRLLIRKMDEHLREKSTLDPGSKRASLLRTTLQATLCATPIEGPTSALGEHLA
jgi:hypothetical protein